jgi:hypothetical protein
LEVLKVFQKIQEIQESQSMASSSSISPSFSDSSEISDIPDLDVSLLSFKDFYPSVIPEKSVSFLINEDETGYDFAMKRTIRFIIVHTILLSNTFKGLYKQIKHIPIGEYDEKSYSQIHSIIYNIHKAFSYYHCWNSIVIREMSILPGKYQFFWTTLYETYFSSKFFPNHQYRYPLYSNETLRKAIREIYQFFNRDINLSVSIESEISQQFIRILQDEIQTFKASRSFDNEIAKVSFRILGNLVSLETSPIDGMYWFDSILYQKNRDSTMYVAYFPKILYFPRNISYYFENHIHPRFQSSITPIQASYNIPLSIRSLFYIDLPYIHLLNQYNELIHKDYGIFLMDHSTHSFLSRKYYNPPDDIFDGLKHPEKQSLLGEPPGLT